MRSSIALIAVTSAVVFVVALVARMAGMSLPWTVVTLAGIVGFLGLEIAWVLRELLRRIEQLETGKDESK